jgi:hypothetical protein
LNDVLLTVDLAGIFSYFRKEGRSGLTKGLEAKLVQSILSAGFMFLTYEKIAAMAFTIMGARRIKQK